MTSDRRFFRMSLAFRMGSCLLAAASASKVFSAQTDNIHLEIHPRVCTLSRHIAKCQIPVQATWRALHTESLCLVILERSDIKHCWENFSSGTYTVQLSFSDDLTFQLRDPKSQDVLAAEVLRVIREAIQYRERRRDLWDIFD